MKRKDRDAPIENENESENERRNDGYYRMPTESFPPFPPPLPRRFHIPPGNAAGRQKERRHCLRPTSKSNRHRPPSERIESESNRRPTNGSGRAEDKRKPPPARAAVDLNESMISIKQTDRTFNRITQDEPGQNGTNKIV